MVLEDLHELVETLQRRIAEHGPALQQSEALTRYALIDPLLRGLGWDTGDPSQVMPEFKSSRGSADYALLGSDGKPDVIIEAKRLGRGLEDAVEQVINYGTREGYEFFAVTDGQRWELYETRRRGDIEEKLVVRLNLVDAPPKTCLAALALWRPSVIAGIIAAGATPVVHPPRAVRTPTQPVPAPTNQDSPGVWLKLSDFIGEKGMKPRELRFPTGTTQQVGTWAEAIEQITQWLFDEGYLSDYQQPISRRKGIRYILSREPRHPNGTQFKNAHQAGPFFIETNFNVPDQVENIQLLIERIGQHPGDFAVRLQ